MKNKITNEELREKLNKFIYRDINFDEMKSPKEPDYSDRHLKMMEELFDKKEDKQLIKVNFRKRVYKMISSFIIVVVIITAGLNHESIAKIVRQLLIKDYGEYSGITIENKGEEKSVSDIEVEYKSNRFKFSSKKDLNVYKIYNYTDNLNNYIKITISRGNGNSFADTEDVKPKRIFDEGIEYYFVRKYQKYNIFYYKDKILYEIETNINYDDILEEIKKINIVK